MLEKRLNKPKKETTSEKIDEEISKNLDALRNYADRFTPVEPWQYVSHQTFQRLTEIGQEVLPILYEKLKTGQIKEENYVRDLVKRIDPNYGRENVIYYLQKKVLMRNTQFHPPDAEHPDHSTPLSNYLDQKIASLGRYIKGLLVRNIPRD